MISFTLIIGIILPALCTLLHYEALTVLSRLAINVRFTPRLSVLCLMLFLPALHVFEMGLYALTYYFLGDFFDPNILSGQPRETIWTFLYFSMETYTSLGFGDLVPHGTSRFLVGIEVLNGLLLIGWSGSFVFLFMQRYWFTGQSYEPSAQQ